MCRSLGSPSGLRPSGDPRDLHTRSSSHFYGVPSPGGLLCCHSWIGRPVDLWTIPETSADIKPLENAIRSTLVPAMLSRVASNNTEWELPTLPTRLGGLGLPCLSRMAQREFDISVSVTTPLTSLVLEQKTSLGSAPEMQQRLKAAALRQKNTNLQAFAHSVVEHLPAQGQRAVQLACEKGSSSWLNALPLVEHGFDLSKSAFRNAVSLRYGWEIKNLPSTCACGAHFNH